MSGWLLMGLPGVAYWYGLSDAAWTTIGLAIGIFKLAICSKKGYVFIHMLLEMPLPSLTF